MSPLETNWKYLVQSLLQIIFENINEKQIQTVKNFKNICEKLKIMYKKCTITSYIIIILMDKNF